MRLRRIAGVVAFLALSISACVAQRKYIVNQRPDNTKNLPFSDAVLVGNTLFIAGTIGLDPKTGQALPNTDAEAKAALDLFKATIENAGFTMDDLVTVQVYCTDLSLYDAFNTIYKTYFHDNFPARAFIGVDKLLRGGHFEVTGIAVKKPN
jgi:2-iminobutanoate/2-iminopropanoate deaminase